MSAKSRLNTTATALTVSENSGPTRIGILAPTDSRYSSSQLTITIGTLPSDGTVLLSDGVTTVYAGETLTVAQLTGLEFKPTAWTFGQTSTLTYSVSDPSGSTASGSATLAIGPDTLAPVTTPASLSVADNAGPTAIGIAAPTDPNYAASQLTVTISTLPTDGTVLLSNGTTAVYAGEKLTVAQLTGLEFSPLASAAGKSSTLTYTVSDPSLLSTTGTATLAVKGAVLTVGAGKEYATLAAAIAASHNGDTIQVQAGTYINDFATITTNITIEGVGGMANLVATEQIPNGKAILVIDGNVTIDNLSFSGAQVDPADANGAGIRYETGNLTLNRDYFFDNQDGLLAGANPSGSITINNSEFSDNGVSDPNSAGYGYTHNLYVGNIATLTISGSYFNDAQVGHEIKSRANTTIIKNSRIDDLAGTASYGIDLPNGGNATISNDVIQQGASAQNPIIIDFGEEGSLLAGTQLAVSGATILNNLSSTSALAVDNHTAAVAQLSSDQFYGLTASQIAAGPDSQSGDTLLATEPALNTTHPWTSAALPVASAATLTVAGDSAATPIGVKAPTDAAYAASQLTVVAVALPTDGTVLLADGVTAVTAGEKLSVGQLTGLEFKPTSGVYNQSSSFTYEVADPVGLAAVGIAILAVGGAPALSPDGATLLAGSGGDLLTSAGTWTFSSSTNSYGNLILLNGAAAADGSATELEVANQGNVYADNAQGQWYEWSGGGWAATTNPTGTTTPIAVSADGSTLLPGSGGSLVTSAGTWTFSSSTNSYGNLILLNGAAATDGSATELEVANQGNLYADNAQGQWYEWTGSSWTSTSAPGSSPTSSPTSPATSPGGTTTDAAPTLLQPSQTGDIVGVRLQNAGTTTENSGYVTFGEVFKTGAVAPTDTLVARINGVNYAVQMDVKSTNSDGSVRQAVLTLDAPSIAVGGYVDLMLAKGTAAAPSPAAPTAASLIAAGYNLAVSFTFHNSNGTTTTASASAAAALQAALTAGTVQTWLSGPGVNEYAVTTTVDGGKLKVEFDIQAYANGTTSTDVIFDNSWMFSSGKTDLNYDVTISQGGQQAYSATGVAQYLYSTWDHQVSSAGTVNPNVQYDIPYLEATGAIPAYDTSLGVSDAVIQANLNGLTAANTGPLGTAGVTTFMPETGGRDDIGAQPAWVAEALMSQNAAAQQVMMADAAAAGGIPWHYIDESTGQPINTLTYPTFWADSRGVLVPASGWPDANPADTWTPDAAHMPDLNYVPYLTTGSPYQLTQLQAEANYALSSTPPTWGSQWLIDGKYPAGFVLDGFNQIRAEAWDLREVAEAAYLTPNNDPLKTYFVSQLQSNMQALVQQYIVDGIDSKYGQIQGFVGYNAGLLEVAPFEEDYLVTSLAEVAGMGIPQASAQAVQMLKWMDNFVAGLFTNGPNGYNPLNGTPYWLAITDPTTGTPYATWAQFQSANVTLGNLSANPTGLADYPLDTQGGYPAIAAAALADEITYTQMPRAIQAYGYVVSQIAYAFAQAGQSETAAYQLNPEWSQMPKLPDGVYLTRSQMQIDTSTNNNVTLTANGGDSLLSVVGSGTDTLNGGTGAVDLFYGGTGNDTFNPGTGNDYLFGGSGKNTFNDNTGNDYYRSGGTANVYWFGEDHSGHDSINAFHTNTDKLDVAANLNGNGITTASQLIAAATVSNGSTVLHLSAQDDITLLGISSPSSISTALAVGPL